MVWGHDEGCRPWDGEIGLEKGFGWIKVEWVCVWTTEANKIIIQQGEWCKVMEKKNEVGLGNCEVEKRVYMGSKKW